MTWTKIVISGNIIEKYEYEKPVTANLKKKDVKISKIKGEGKEERKKDYKNYTVYRARENIRRLALCNFTNKDTFMTLTFEDNITFTEVANNAFKGFIRRIKAIYAEFKYLAVIEFQERGAVHYHMLCNLPLQLIEGADIREKERNLFKYVWGFGWVDLADIYDCDNVGAYLIKYLQKSFNDENKLEAEKKRYLCSKGLIKPHAVDFEEFDGIKNVINKMVPVFTSEYDSLVNGGVKYSEYNLKRGDTYK